MSNRRHWYLLNNEKTLKGLFMSDALTQLNNIRTLRSQTREMCKRLATAACDSGSGIDSLELHLI